LTHELAAAWSRLKRPLPFVAFGFCLFNWIYTQRACWWIELGSVHHSQISRVSVRKGLYAEDGVLMFANSIWDGMFAGIRPPDWKTRPTRITFGGFDAGYSVPHLDWTLRSSSHRASIRMWTSAAYMHRWGFSKLGFTALWQPGDHGFVQRGVAVPWWFLTAVFAITPIRRVLESLHRRRHARAGLCLACGYDMRATPLRCPECGRDVMTAIPTAR
jgi:hypothetical protein